MKGAIKEWTKREQNLDVPGLSKLWRTRMFAQLMESKPVAIEGLVGVFCASVRINRKPALLNLVEDGAR